MTALVIPWRMARRAPGPAPDSSWRLALPCAVAGALTGAVVALGGAALLLPVSLVVGLLGIAVHHRRPGLLPLLAVGIAAVPPLLFLPLSVAVGGKSLYLSDLLLPLAALLAVTRRSRVPRLDLVVWVYAGVLLLQAAVGVVRNQPFEAFTQDLRGPVYLVLGYLVGSRLLAHRPARAPLVALAAVLGYSAGLMVFTILTGVEVLAGRTEGVQAFQAGLTQEIDATRFIVESKGLAFITLVAGTTVLLSLASTGRQRLVAAALVVPAFVVTFLSYARATLLALVVCSLLLALMRRPPVLNRRRTATAALVLTAAVGAVGLTGSAGTFSDPGGNAAARQVAGFEARVLGGLTEETLDSPGNTYRVTENRYALQAWAHNPLFGHGIGASFKPDRIAADPALRAFEDNPEFGTRFIHNGWLWYGVKTGAVGLLAFAAFVMAPVVLALRRRGHLGLHPAQIGLAVSVVGLLVINVFEPDLHRVGTAPVAGAVLGYLTALSVRRQGSDTDGPLTPAATRPVEKHA